MLGLLVLCSMFSFVASHKGCCSMDQWEGWASELESGERQTAVFQQKIYIAYDYANQLYAETFYTTFAGREETESYIYDFGHHKGYRFTKDKESCLKFIVDKSFRKCCVIDGTYSLGENYIGVDPNRILTRTFLLHPPKQQYNITSVVSWDDPKCIPIYDLSFGTKNNLAFVKDVLYTDITAGIKDPSVFTPPDYCVKSFEVEPQETSVSFLIDHLHNKFMH